MTVSAWWSRRSRTAEVRVASWLKISGQCLNTRFVVIAIEPRSYRWLMIWNSRSAPVFVDGEIAEFVEDEQSRSEVAAQVAFELSGGLSGGESVDGVNGAGEQHGVATLARLQAQSGDQMGLAEPDAADEHDVGGVVEEAQAEEVSGPGGG